MSGQKFNVWKLVLQRSVLNGITARCSTRYVCVPLTLVTLIGLYRALRTVWKHEEYTTFTQLSDRKCHEATLNDTVLPDVFMGFRGYWRAIRIVKNALNGRSRFMNSPLKGLPLSIDGTAEPYECLPYSPNIFPGARDVTTPYGTLRAYEWGCEHGQKILLIHGISTPCIGLSQIALNLVVRGWRVLLFDLFGHGYSDGPNPRHYPNTAEFFIAQCFYVLKSSPLEWMNHNKFCLLGYSLGGGIAMEFASYFHRYIDRIILLAPSGILRLSNTSWECWILHKLGRYLPDVLLYSIILKSNWTKTNLNKKRRSLDSAQTAENQSSKLSDVNLDLIELGNIVNWQCEAHSGFIPAYASAMQYGPIFTGEETWKRVRDGFSHYIDIAKTEELSSVSTRKSSSSSTATTLTQHASPDTNGLLFSWHEAARIWCSDTENGQVNSRILIILGAKDNVVRSDEVLADALTIFAGLMQYKVLPTDHNLPCNTGRTIASLICNFCCRAK